MSKKDWFEEPAPQKLDDKIFRAVEGELVRNKVRSRLRTRRQWLFAFAGLGTAAALVIVSRQTMTETEDLQLADFTEEEILDAEGLDLLAQTDADFEDSLEFLEALEDLEVLEEGDV